MSRIITNTNIIVDDFEFCKSFPKNTFIHFLSHFHADHYKGLTQNWNYGPIYCTHQTKVFMLDNFPKLKRVYSYEYYRWQKLILAQDKKDLEFIFFDAEHIIGSAMILFRGYMGTILFTGDFRYNFNMVLENNILFPPELRKKNNKQSEVQKMSRISLKIDQMIFDNTYCNKVFKFQTQKVITKRIIDIIDKNREKELIFIAMSALGKHRVLIQIGEYFQTSIIVSEKEMRKIHLAKMRSDFLTTKSSEGFIELIGLQQIQYRVSHAKVKYGSNFICINTDFLMVDHHSPDKINYIVPYSLHSNFQEMETFIRMIQPCILRKLVLPINKSIKLKIKIDHRYKLSKYFFDLEKKMEKSQSGYFYLVKYYTKIYQLSAKFLQWFDPDAQRYLMNEFGLGSGEQNHDFRRHKPRLFSEQQISNRSSTRKKPSRKQIAEKLNGANKNETIEAAFLKGSQMRINRQYSQIYRDMEWNSQESNAFSETKCQKRYK